MSPYQSSNCRFGRFSRIAVQYSLRFTSSHRDNCQVAIRCPDRPYTRFLNPLGTSLQLTLRRERKGDGRNQAGSVTIRATLTALRRGPEGGAVRRRRNASDAIAPAAIIVCALLAGGDALAAPAPAGPGSSAREAPSKLMLVGAGASMQASASRPSPPPFVRPRRWRSASTPSEAPTIDADLSDPVWAKAAVIDNFTAAVAQSRTSPRPNERWCASCTTRTISISRSTTTTARRNAIVVRNMQRDGQVFTSDSVMHLSRSRARRGATPIISRSAHQGGAPTQLELNNTEELTEWDAIWEGARAHRARWLGGGDRDSVQEPLL